MDAQKDLREVVDELERYILRPTLITEGDLQARRDAEDPLNQLANHMIPKLRAGEGESSPSSGPPAL